MKLKRYCTCGAVLNTTVDRRKRQQVLICWFDRHSGDGHAETDDATAEMARMGQGQGKEAPQEARSGGKQ